MKKHIDLDLLKRFYVVAQHKNITKAAQELHMTQPALSRSLKNLEESAGEKLFARIATGMELNPKGEQLLAYAKNVLADLAKFERVFFDDENQISGDLKINVFPYIGAEMIIPLLKGFTDLHPHIRISIDSNPSADPKDMLPITHDVSICDFIQNQDHLIQKKLLTFHTHLFASPEYLEKNGIPQSFEDLHAHNVVFFKNHGLNAAETNLYGQNRNFNSRIEHDSIRGIIHAALSGYGICELPDFSPILNSGLHLILPDIKGKEGEVFYVFNENRKKSRKINAFYEYIAENIK